MNVLLWVLQVLLAVVFIAHGLLLLMPPPEIAAQMVMSLPRSFWVFLGVAEIAAAIGLTLPGLARVKPWLVAWAAGGIMIVIAALGLLVNVAGEISSAAVTFSATCSSARWPCSPPTRVIAPPWPGSWRSAR